MTTLIRTFHIIPTPEQMERAKEAQRIDRKRIIAIGRAIRDTLIIESVAEAVDVIADVLTSADLAQPQTVDEPTRQTILGGEVHEVGSKQWFDQIEEIEF